MKELKLKYGCNPNQKTAGIFMKDGKLSIKVINGNPGYINLLDAFFPFGNNIERARKSGVSYVAQTGDSIRDDNVIETCNKYNIAMAFTDIRLFHH